MIGCHSSAFGSTLNAIYSVVHGTSHQHVGPHEELVQIFSKPNATRHYNCCHGDDFTASGTDADLDLYGQALQETFEIKLRG